MLTRRTTVSGLVMVCALWAWASSTQGQICEPAPDEWSCVQVVCSDIPEDQCLPRVLHLEVATGAVRVGVCECMNFNQCHIEFGDASPRAVGYCPDGQMCEVVAWDSNGDGKDDSFAAECPPTTIGACCLDIDDGPVGLDTCVEATEKECHAQGGKFVPVNTGCSKIEACCVPFGSDTLCTQLNPHCCVLTGGVPLGPGSSCETDPGIDPCGQICGGLAGIPCEDPKEFCKIPVGHCCCDFFGMCTPHPIGCPDVWDPVCGCDGKTYGNACEADATGVSLDHFGECKPPCVTDADCSDGNGCTIGLCINGLCEYADAPDGTACDDGDPCTKDDMCKGGICAGAVIPGCGACSSDADCDDGNVCTDDFCDPATGRCQYFNHSALCDDGNSCTEHDVCADGVCIGTPIPGCGACSSDADCDDGSGCTIGLCINGLCEYVDAPDGTVCDDGDPCTKDDMCKGGLCTGVPIPGCGACSSDADCDDGNVCTDDLCDPAMGQCRYFNNSEPCDDGNVCTEGDVCTEGICVGAPIPGCGACSSDADCDNGNGCTIGRCINGLCEYVDAPDGTTCDDGDPCTMDDACTGGVCTGTPIPDCGACSSDADCMAVNHFCLFPVGTCGDSSVRGVCVPVPVGCPDVWDPVCGCDGKTYGNACEAAMARMSIAHHGECKPVCEPVPDGTGCTAGPCGLIPEDQCLPTLLRLDSTGIPPRVVACECMDFNLCHVELKHGVPVAIGYCPNGGVCRVVELDMDGDGIVDHLRAGCIPDDIGACCFDLSGSPLPHPQCIEATGEACEAEGGLFGGVGTTCEPPVACCMALAGATYCVETSPVCCEGLGGIPQGPGTTCEDVVCGEPCGGPSGIPCDEAAEFCKFPDSTCGTGDVMGACTPIPTGCPFLWDPVCGCDGVTYPNECTASWVGISVAHRGECAWICCDPRTAPECADGPYCCADGHWECGNGSGTYSCDAPGVVCQPVCGGPHGIPCDGADSFCKFPVGTCADRKLFGMCTPRPGACPEVYDPVCGCDGRTYSNECEADAAGVSIAYWGECKPKYCWSNDMCTPRQYCLFHGCAAETGVCVPRPEACPDVWDPVCGCDGVTYPNACEAARAGMSVDYPGVCMTALCWSNDMCSPDQYCLFHVCAAETGTCVPRPVACPEVWDPVCGCDGVTYPNACEAARAGMSVDYRGECRQFCSRVDPSIACGPDEFCKFPPGTCDDATVPGVCTTVPVGCPEFWDPVCGCDGVTYPNECFADMAMTSVNYRGECEICAARRILSQPEPTYCPGVPKMVQIQLSPREGVTAIALEDTPPTGWQVTYISGDGVYDAVNGKVKWGPFFGGTLPRSVSYEVIAPPTQAGAACFEGTVSLDGVNEPICGDTCIERSCQPYMAADSPQPPCPVCPVGDCTTCPERGCHDWRISLCEVIGYACAWLVGCNDDLAGVTRAAYIWRNGECYCWDEERLNWFPTACPPPESGLCGPTGTVPGIGDGKDVRISTTGKAVASLRSTGRDGRHGKARDWTLSVAIAAPTDASAMALDFSIPSGWELKDISDGGKWDEVHQKVKWGPFHDRLTRTVTLELRQKVSSVLSETGDVARAPEAIELAGTVSFDGVNRPITVR